MPGISPARSLQIPCIIPFAETVIGLSVPSVFLEIFLLKRYLHAIDYCTCTYCERECDKKQCCHNSIVLIEHRDPVRNNPHRVTECRLYRARTFPAVFRTTAKAALSVCGRIPAYTRTDTHTRSVTRFSHRRPLQAYRYRAVMLHSALSP